MAPVHNKSIHLPLLFTLLSLSLSLSTAAARRDTITPTQPLSDNETLVSAGGTFALGFFFTPNDSDRRYIGIWYYNETVYQRKVWVANRDRPVFGSTGQLSVAANGTITITNRDSTHVVWYVDTNFIGLSNPVVQLLDTGNFVLKGDQGYNNIQDYYLWQSFDYPTDTLLPGMKLGLNRRLPAWRSDDDPSPGDYCAAMVIDDRPEMYVFNRSSKLWRSGPWDGNQLGSITQWNPNAGGLAYSFVNTSEEVAFQVGAQTILMVDTSGLLQMQGLDLGESGLFWQSQDNPCDNIGWCGSNAICDSTKSPNMCRCLLGFTPKNPANSTGGCVRMEELDCRNGTDGFLVVDGVKLPASSISLDSLISLDECRVQCLMNCSCTAYAFINGGGGGGGCVIWVTDLLDVVQFNSTKQSLYIRIGGADLVSHPQSHNANGRTVAIIVSVISGALLFSCLIFFLWRRKKRGTGRTDFLYDKLDEDHRRKDLDLLMFNFGTIAAATESFSAKNKLGQGGFGPVYKGILGGDKEIAVKRLAKSSQQGAEEFKNEVILIAKLQNRNLVRLLGCCIQGEERMLIYEYMPNKSLDAFIFEKEKAALLDWRTRYQIIVGITRGLLYLHHDSRYRIIHRDLKASNILLDKEMNPKISDFGIARLFNGDEIGYNTKKVVGTYGYMSPEYAMEGIFSLKSDVYSFGVLLLEIISGRKNRGSYAFSQHLNLVAHTWSLWNEDESLEIVDEAMNNNFRSNDVLKCIKIGLLCVQNNPVDRPLMSSVIEMLGADITSLQQPKQPSFLARMDPEFDHISGSKDLRMSNELTVTLDGR